VTGVAPRAPADRRRSTSGTNTAAPKAARQAPALSGSNERSAKPVATVAVPNRIAALAAERTPIVRRLIGATRSATGPAVGPFEPGR
jgi:hypothetical protein